MEYKSHTEKNIQVFQFDKGNVNSIDIKTRKQKLLPEITSAAKIIDRVVSLITNRQEPSKRTQSFFLFFHGNSIKIPYVARGLA